MPTEAKIVVKGKSDSYTFKGSYKNPYPMALQEFNRHERGWTQSMKFDGGKVVEMSNKPAQLPVAGRSTPDTNIQRLCGFKGPRQISVGSIWCGGL